MTELNGDTVRPGSRPAAEVPAVDAMTLPATADTDPSASAPAEGGASVLFGRGLLYVAVWSLQLLSALIVSPVLAHLLPPGEFGQLASAIALHQVLVVLAVVGLDQVLVLVRAELGHDRPARSLIAVGLVLACVLTVVAAVTAPVWSEQLGFTGSARILVITIAWTPPAAGIQLVGVLLLSQDRLKAFSVVSILSSIGGQLVGLGILLGSGSRLASSYASGNLVTLLLTLVVALVLARPRWRGIGEGDLVRRALVLGLPLMISSLAVYVLNAGDRLVIQRLLGAAEAGRYQIAYTVGNLAVLLLSVTSGAWAPRIAAIRDEAARWVMIGAARDGLMRLMAPVMLGMTLGAPLLLVIVAPASYAPSDLLVVVFLVALAAFPVLVGTATGRALITLRRTREVAVAAIAAAVVNIVLNLVLVPHWELSGAALATVVAFATQAGVQRLALMRRATLPRMRVRIWLPAALAVTVSAATLVLPQSLGWAVGRAAVALLCLPWLLHLLRSLRQADGPLAAGTLPDEPAEPAPSPAGA